MDKRWRNLGVMVVAIIIIGILFFNISFFSDFFVFDQVSDEISLKQVINDYYSQEELVNFDVYSGDLDKLSLMESKLELINSQELSEDEQIELVYYKGLVELKIDESNALFKIDSFSETDDICFYFEDLIELEFDFFDLKVKSVVLNEMRDDYFYDKFVNLDLNYYDNLYYIYKDQYDFLFMICKNLTILEEIE